MGTFYVEILHAVIELVLDFIVVNTGRLVLNELVESIGWRCVLEDKIASVE